MSGNWQDWTPCEMYGHDYETDEGNPNKHVCIECGDSYEDD